MKEEKKNKCVVIDIDGVILDSAFLFDEIFEKGLKGDDMWDYFHANCNSGKVKVFNNIIPFLNIFFPLRIEFGIETILLTSRNDKVLEETINKLKEEKIFFDKIIMRKEGDYREASVLKKEVLEELQKEYNIICFIDDDLNNCKAAKELGILSLRRV